MTVEEAKEYLLCRYLVVGSPVNPPAGECEKHNAAIDIAIAALNTQIPQKIMHIKRRPTEWGSEYCCPLCGSEQIHTVFFRADGTEPEEKYTWCSDCG